MNSPKQSPDQQVETPEPQQPVGGSIIDAEGREVPITEHMIQHACDELDKDFVIPKPH
ncbi:hypothetical protein I0D00_02140 [Pseudomonas lalucatii]|uniref:Multifunctional fatty acid oxidation complex subunit alpha n=1 Tax=Pseudomonas lalucatii TaxID=1424203 RepID=A0ABS5PXZ5_9PSED|nr:PA1571 family protein [Pseudomonas lalucatii]MBS7660749.1 hypothetical protein [Pseudomonas lalucatii]MBS7691407.1 hypothetical protein [Pseudomonas lalucatii]QVM87530.1 hypothetical protein I0D68_21120 [Pseudomonas lalucatii]